MSKEIISFKCDVCSKLYTSFCSVCNCEYNHARGILANAMLDRGDNLSYINSSCGFSWELTDKQSKITKDSLFIISYLQCCELPVYKIIEISEYGEITVRGKGSDGYYSSIVELTSLTNPVEEKKKC